MPAGLDAFEFIDRHYIAISEKEESSGEQSLSDSQIVVRLTWYASGIVENGGFRLLFQTDSDFNRIALAFGEIGLPKAEEIIRKALSYFPNSKPQSDARSRNLYMNKIQKDRADLYEKLSGEFDWACSALEDNLAKYIRSNLSDVTRGI